MEAHWGKAKWLVKLAVALCTVQQKLLADQM